jgi:hypothetical protein
VARRIDILYFDGGGAHRSAAFSIQAELALRAAEHDLDVRVVNTSEIFPRAPLLDLLLGRGIQIYNSSLQRERMWFGDLGVAIRFGIGCARLLEKSSVPRLVATFAERAPDLLISTLPIYDAILFEALRRACPGVPAVVVPCDFEEIAPRYWFDPRWDAHFACGTEKLVADARGAGIPEDRVHRIPGMPIHPSFFAPAPALTSDDVTQARADLGLSPELPTVLLFFGGQGSNRLVDIAHHLDAADSPANLIVICGRNDNALRELSGWRSSRPKHVVGFTPDVLRLMRLADVMICRPGPLSIFEALAVDLPVIVWDNPAFSVLFDENVRWIAAEGVGLSVRALDEVAPAVHRVTSDPAFRAATRRFRRSGTAAIADLALRLSGNR